MRAAALALTLVCGCGSTAKPSELRYLYADGGRSWDVHVDPTLSSIQAKIFTPTCTVSPCHNANDKAGNLILLQASALTSLIDAPAFEVSPKQLPDGGYVTRGAGVEENLCNGSTSVTATVPKLVVAGDPTNSYLMWKLTGKDATGALIENDTDCSTMPKVAGVTLTSDQISAIETWIANGAQDD